MPGVDQRESEPEAPACSGLRDPGTVLCAEQELVYRL